MDIELLNEYALPSVISLFDEISVSIFHVLRIELDIVITHVTIERKREIEREQ